MLAYASNWLIVVCVISLMLLEVNEGSEWQLGIAIALFMGTVALLLFVVYLQWQWRDDDDESSLATADDIDEGSRANSLKSRSSGSRKRWSSLSMTKSKVAPTPSGGFDIWSLAAALSTQPDCQPQSNPHPPHTHVRF